MIKNNFKLKFRKSADDSVNLMDEIPGVVFKFRKTVAGELKFEYVSSKIEELTGLSPSQFLKLDNPIQEYTHGEDVESALTQLDASATYLTPFEWQGRISIKNKMKWIHIKGSPTKNKSGDVTWAGLLIDITLQRFLMDQFLEYKSRQIGDDKISSLNQMASGIAHEINTPLTTAKMNMEMIQTRLVKSGTIDESLTKYIQRFSQAIEKISDVIDRLRQLSKHRSGEESKQLIDLNSIVNSCVEHVSDYYLQQYEVKVHAQICSEVLPVMANEGKVFQAILNLVTNAKDAVVDQKTKIIEISTYSTPVYSYLKIKDNGIGIPKNMLNKIFEPFYTTKQKHMKSGVGLSISGTIFSEHDAIIDIASNHVDENPFQHGTEITIKFPIAAAAQNSDSELKSA